MGFSFSGLIAEEAQNGLMELLAQRRLEQQMKQQEAERLRGHNLDVARFEETKKRNQFDEERARRQDQLDEAEVLAGNLSAGFDPTSPLDVEVSESDAATLKGTPQGARVRELPMIDATPIVPGMSRMGPQGVGVRRLTPDAEQQGQRRVVGIRRRVSGELAGAQNEEERRRAAARAFEEGVNVPPVLTNPTVTEQLRLQEDARKVENAEWDRRNAVSEANIRSRPDRPPRTELSPPQKFQYTRQLRGDFNRETAAAREMGRQFGLMEEAMKSAMSGGGLNPASQAILVTFQKSLDPDSVVRESEYARSPQGMALLDRIQGIIPRIVRGGPGVPVEQLQEFVELSRTFVKRQTDSAQSARTQIESIADEFGLDKNLITSDFGAQLQGGGDAQGPQPGDEKTFPNGRKGRWDGKGWVQVP